MAILRSSWEDLIRVNTTEDENRNLRARAICVITIHKCVIICFSNNVANQRKPNGQISDLIFGWLREGI